MRALPGFVILVLLLLPTVLGGLAAAPAVRSQGDATPEPFAFRAVANAGYGPPWPFDDRMDLIEWSARVGYNVLLYAPLENPYMHVAWREPFPDWMLAEWETEIAYAHELGIRWMPMMAPGHPLLDQVILSREICFSCNADFELLAGKYQWWYDHGVRDLFLRFDDVVPVSTHPEDALAFGVGEDAYGRMNAHLANALLARFPDALWIMSPKDYFGTLQTPYLAALAEHLDLRVRLIWTGPEVLSLHITGEDADKFAAAVSPPDGPLRPLVIWDNYPVNDYNGAGYTVASALRTVDWDYPGGEGVRLHLHLGPVKGRQADLVGHAEGFLANAMIQPLASKFALASLAAYLLDPLAYTDEPVSCPENPAARTKADCLFERAWLDGMKTIDGEDGQVVLDIANQMRATPFDRTDAPVLEARTRGLVASMAGPFWLGPHDELRDELDRQAASAARVRGGFPSERLTKELAPHVEGLERNLVVGLKATELLAAQRPDIDLAPVRRAAATVVVSGTVTAADPSRAAALSVLLAEGHARSLEWPYVAHGDRLQHTLSNAWVAENRMDAFVAAAQGAYAQWLPLAPLAAAGPLTVTVDGTPVPVAPDGTFSAVVAAHPHVRSVEVVVTDAAGFATGARLPLPGAQATSGP